MFLLLLFILAIVFLAGTFFLTSISGALRRIHKRGSLSQFLIAKSFFYRPIHSFFLPNNEFEEVYFASICGQSVTRFCSTALFLAFLYFDFLISSPDWLGFSLCLIAFLIFSFIFGDFLPRIFGTRYPNTTLKVCTPVASIFLLLIFPFTYVFLKLSKLFSKNFYFDLTYEPMAEAQREIIEMIQKVDLRERLDIHDKKLIESVMRFKERIAREVMVPRVKVFSLAAETSIKEAAKILENEGYSRTPIYRGNVDNIVGVLMYKDVLTKFIEFEQRSNDSSILEAPIETIQKNVLHTPETKKISSLLQEFRKKQVHLAIVVDEYGGTEGIVTIEDILEEIVGEIADEYDQEAEPFYAQSDGTWIVDARMNIVDADEALGIKIPEEGDYDTIGGYIYHTTGTIPSKGFVIHHEEFELEILQSNDRSVEKVRIKPFKKKSEEG